MALNTRSRRKTPHQVKTEDDINEIITYFGQCKCCLKYAYLKSMWNEHNNNKGKKEVYGKMLVECFAIPWIIEEKVDDKICEMCIVKLRSAVTFKEIVMNSQKELKNKFKEEEIDKSLQCNIKEDQDYSSHEQVEDSEYYKDVQFLDEDMMEQEVPETKVLKTVKTKVLDKQRNTKTNVKQKMKRLKKYKRYTRDTLLNAIEAVKAEQMTPRQASMKFNVPRKTIYTMLTAEKGPEIGASEIDESLQCNIKVDQDYSSNEQVEDSEHYNDVQFLDEDIMEQEVLKTEVLETDFLEVEVIETEVLDTKVQETVETKVLDEQPNTKTNVKQKKRKSLRKYRQYTSDTMFNAMEAVKAEQMAPREASMKFNVPSKTICTMLTAGERPVTLNALIMARFFKDISAILKHTNATPFRSKGNNFYCLFCQDEDTFKDPVKLREHTHSVHKHEEVRLEFAMRPYYANEMLKLDVKDLTCVICDVSLSWSEIIEHLEQHDVYLELVKTRIVPYELNINELICVLCDYNSVFTLMDSHMNVHYKNYICGECGDTFITAARFNSHMKKHKTGIYPCSFCNKIFARELYRKKHIDVVHNKKSTFKCWYCTERFLTESDRRIHAKEHHSDKILSQRNCKLCNKSLPSHLYSKHVKRCKGQIKYKCDEYKCDECEKTFIRQKLLDDHKLKHTGVKNFQCDICFKSYFSSAAVSMHKKYKHNILRSMCEANDLIKHFKVDVHA